MKSNAKKFTQPLRAPNNRPSRSNGADSESPVPAPLSDVQLALMRDFSKASSLIEVKNVGLCANKLKRHAQLTQDHQMTIWMYEIEIQVQHRIDEMTLEAAKTERLRGSVGNQLTYPVSFVGPLAVLETELQMGARYGYIAWCDAFRDMHDGSLAEPAPTELLEEFAEAAPTVLLGAYVIGAVFARATSRYLGMSLTEWLTMANQEVNPARRGKALGRAFRAISAEIIRRRPS